MKRFTSSLLVLVLSAVAFAPAAKADTVQESRLTPFNLSTLAYQGRLSNEGIPGYGALAVGIQTGSITAETVIEAAIDAGRLPETAQDNSTFVSAVARQLDNLADRNHN